MTIVLVSWSKHNILDFRYFLILCSYFKSTTKHLVSAKMMLLVSEGVVISPPLSSLTLFGGDITPFLEHYGEGGGFPPRGWYPPIVLIWPWATGADIKALCRYPSGKMTRHTWLTLLCALDSAFLFRVPEICHFLNLPLHYLKYRRTLHIRSHSWLCLCCCRSPGKTPISLKPLLSRIGYSRSWTKWFDIFLEQ